MNDRMLRDDDVSEILAIDKRTLRSWRAAGTGPPTVRLGKYVRYPAAALQKWLEDLQAKAS